MLLCTIKVCSLLLCGVSIVGALFLIIILLILKVLLTKLPHTTSTITIWYRSTAALIEGGRQKDKADHILSSYLLT